ncbi:MAG: NAD(P)/FAD-dependent oxidoreductase [Deltaproteobacteria bacterium]|nr:MAG: NAD(P)/FAD-dependent oxidoreductase [Deltaproteobacteria bacterium]
MEMKRSFVIVGAGVAGISAAKAIRAVERECEITIVEEGIAFPYYRAALGEVVLGKKGPEEILIEPLDFYDRACLRLRKGQRVVSVSVSGRYVYLSNNERLRFDALLVATGRREVIPAHLKKYAPHLSTFSTLEDALKIRDALPSLKAALLRGKGFNALELARVLVKSGVQVTLVTPDKRLYYPALPDDENEHLRNLIREAGIQLIEGDDVNRVEEKNKGLYSVELLSGKTVECGLVFASGGFAPNVSFLKNSGIYLNQGVIVDDYLQSTEEGIFAAGDCAEIYHPSIGRYWVNLGHPNAARQGEVAGRNMAGEAMERLEIEKMRPYTIFGEQLYARWWD